MPLDTTFKYDHATLQCCGNRNKKVFILSYFIKLNKCPVLFYLIVHDDVLSYRTENKLFYFYLFYFVPKSDVHRVPLKTASKKVYSVWFATMAVGKITAFISPMVGGWGGGGGGLV